MKDPVIRGEKLIDNISCQTDRWGSFKEALTSKARFWNPAQYSPRAKLIDLVWTLTYIFKVFRNDFDSYCKDLTKKVMIFLSKTD